MPDNKIKTMPEDTSRVNVNSKYQVAYWTTKFGVSAIQLRVAVMRVGTSARAVERELKRR